MTHSIHTIHGRLEVIIEDEGGWKYTDHPLDAGGPTYGGMTLKTLNAFLIFTGAETISNVQFAALAKADDSWLKTKVLECYNSMLANANKFESAAIAYLWADFCVTSGEKAATKQLQEACNKYSMFTNPNMANWQKVNHGSLQVDGILGPQTLARVLEVSTNELLLLYTWQRCAYYSAIVAKDESQRVFAVGWTNRAWKAYMRTLGWDV